MTDLLHRNEHRDPILEPRIQHCKTNQERNTLPLPPTVTTLATVSAFVLQSVSVWIAKFPFATTDDAVLCFSLTWAVSGHPCSRIPVQNIERNSVQPSVYVGMTSELFLRFSFLLTCAVSGHPCSEAYLMHCNRLRTAKF